MKKILIVEDDNSLSQLLNLQLKYSGYESDITDNGDEAIEMIRKNDYILILLDVMIYGKDGVEVAKTVREFSDVPIIMLTAKDSLNDKLVGFESGIDDYMTKPFEFAELLMRIKANTRSKPHENTNVLEHKEVKINLETFKAERDGIDLNLTKNEFKILKLLLEKKGKVVTKEEIINEIWEGFYDEDNNIVFVYINYLRAKLDKNFDEKLIENIRGVGYIIR